MNSVEKIAEKLETLRINLVKLNFRRGVVHGEKSSAESYIFDTGSSLTNADGLIKELEEKQTALSDVTKKLNRTPKMMKKTRDALIVEKSGLHSQISEFDFALRRELFHLNADSPEDFGQIRTKLDETKALIPKLQSEENKLTAEIDDTLSDYRDTESAAKTLDPADLTERRQLLRIIKESEARKDLNPQRDEYAERLFNRSVDTVSEWIGEPPPHYLTEQEAAWLEADNRAKEEAEARSRQRQEERERKIAEQKSKTTAKRERRER